MSSLYINLYLFMYLKLYFINDIYQNILTEYNIYLALSLYQAPF